MGLFKTELSVIPLETGLTWKLAAPLIWISEDGRYVEVPAGFVTDFASVPRIFWSILPMVGYYTKAAVLHDFLYHKPLFSRDRADSYFLEAMRDCGTTWLQRSVIFNQVRMFGWFAWRKYRKLERLIKI